MIVTNGKYEKILPHLIYCWHHLCLLSWMMFYTGFISIISTKSFIAPFSHFMPWLCLTCIVGLPIEKEGVLIIPRCPVTPCPCRCRICGIITESSHPNVCILDEVLKKSIGSSIRYRGQITNIVRNIILTIGPSPFPGHQQRKILVASSCRRVGDIIIFTHWKKIYKVVIGIVTNWQLFYSHQLVQIRLCSLLHLNKNDECFY